MKLLVAWTLLLMADFLLGFRFEYLWPFWLLLRSIYDSFRYQGVVRSPPLPLHHQHHRLLPGLQRVLRVHHGDVGPSLLPLHPRAVALLPRQHIRLGPVRLACRLLPPLPF